jgi:hypothetical protein
MSRGSHIWVTLLVAVLVALALFWALTLGNFPLNRLYSRMVRPLLTITLGIGVGLLLGMIMESAGLAARLGRVAAPLLRFGHLKEPSALAFIAAYFSAITASTILMNAYRDQTISRRELVLSTLILTFPVFFAHLPSMFFIITPLLGRLGIYYLGILLAADLLRTSAYLIYGRLALPAYQPRPLPPSEARPSWSQIWQETWGKFLERLHRILVVTIPVFVAVFLAQEGGLFDWLGGKLTGLLRVTQVPVQALSILAFSLAAETTGGFAAAGAFLQSQALSSAAVLFTLLAGTILASPMRALRHQMPYYLGVFGPGLGLRLMILSQLFRTLSLLPFMALIYVGWLR